MRRRHWAGRTLTGIALAGAIILLGYATYLVVIRGASAFDLAPYRRSDFFLLSCVPALALTPCFLLAYQWGRKGRDRAAGVALSWGVVLIGLVLLVPRGVYALGWHLQPVLILFVTCTFGSVPGVLLASAVVAGLLASAPLTVGIEVAATVAVPGVWTQAAAVGAVVVAMALFGSLLQHTLSLAISAEEAQLQRMDEARRALRHRENLLRHAMRIDTVGDMASMVVHQLRNQFQLILGYAAAGIEASRGSDDRGGDDHRGDVHGGDDRGGDDERTGAHAGERAAAHFHAIVNTLGQSNDLLEGLLGLARSDSGTVVQVDLAELCRQACASYRQVLPVHIDLDLVVPDGPVPVRLNPQGLEHALLNLVINARQAIEGRGTIRLRLTVHGVEARLAVEDTGSGIVDADVAEIFKPFFTTKPKGEGTGLGLAAVHRFVLASQGEISVASEPGVGTVFRLTFPLAVTGTSQAG